MPVSGGVLRTKAERKNRKQWLAVEVSVWVHGYTGEREILYNGAREKRGHEACICSLDYCENDVPTGIDFCIVFPLYKSIFFDL